MKRIISILLSLVLVCEFTGCSAVQNAIQNETSEPNNNYLFETSGDFASYYGEFYIYEETGENTGKYYSANAVADISTYENYKKGKSGYGIGDVGQFVYNNGDLTVLYKYEYESRYDYEDEYKYVRGDQYIYSFLDKDEYLVCNKKDKLRDMYDSEHTETFYPAEFYGYSIPIYVYDYDYQDFYVKWIDNENEYYEYESGWDTEYDEFVDATLEDMNGNKIEDWHNLNKDEEYNLILIAYDEDYNKTIKLKASYPCYKIDFQNGIDIKKETNNRYLDHSQLQGLYFNENSCGLIYFK